MDDGLRHTTASTAGEPECEPEPMRIAIVSPELGLQAGVPHYWAALAVALASRHEVHVFAASVDGAPLDGVHVHRLLSIPAGWTLKHASFYVSARARFALARLIGQEPFDLVLGIGALTPFADVVTAHFSQERELELQRARAYPPERPPRGAAAVDYALYGRLMRWLERRFYAKTKKRVVAISENVKTDLIELCGVPPEQISIVPNGVDTERFHPRNRERYGAAIRDELGLAPDDFVMLFVGNSWGRKGLRTVIDAVAGLPSGSAKLLVVGDGSPAAFLAGRSPELVGRVIFAGVQSEAVERYYGAANVFVLPTLYEPFGLVIMEALASGLPSIVSARAGAAQLLDDGEDALLLRDPLDAGELRVQLMRIMDDHALAVRLAANGRRIAERLTWQYVARRLLLASGVPAL